MVSRYQIGPAREIRIDRDLGEIHFRTHLYQIKIPRWTQIDKKKTSKLYIFCDASETAYGTVAYESKKALPSL